MKVGELRDTIATYDQAQLQLLVVEMYKALPKKIKEEKEIDSIVKLQFPGPKKREPARRDLEEIEDETLEFLDDAYNQYYFAPNNVIHKKNRPKWRFIVKRLYKELLPWTDEEPKRVGELLDKLYRMLCYATSYLLFNSNDPFASVGVEQSMFLSSVIAAKLKQGADKETMAEIISAAAEVYGWGTNSSGLDRVVVEMLKTPPLKELAIEQVQVLYKKSYKNKESQDVWRENLAFIGFALYASLYEYEQAAKWFKQSYPARNEPKLYVLLRVLEMYDAKETWVAEYEEAIAKNVSPRSALQIKYQILKHELSSTGT
jgi:alkylhydroperoxidase/carboxymuconolactone decarboxylase family protein YurZ